MHNFLLPVSQNEFNLILEPLGPWGEDNFDSSPVIIAVSGGADSLCLALLASRWRQNVFALIVDHGIRNESKEEAILTQKRLKCLGIPSEILIIENFKRGSALEERARIKRYQILIDTCCKMGSVDLLLGHHAGDQAETVMMRIQSGSGNDGIASMALITDLPQVRLIRPFLKISPQRLKETLRKENIQWVEDPSNQDIQFTRNQLRKELSVSWKTSGTVSLLLKRAWEEGKKRMENDQLQAHYIMQNIIVRSEGFALFSNLSMNERVLGALIRTISGSIYAPLQKSIQKLVHSMRKVTLGGVQICSAGRLGNWWLIIREEKAIEKAKVALPNIIWDHRFRVVIPNHEVDKDVKIAALGDAYKEFSCRQGLPVCILKTLPAFWRKDRVIAVPHLNICFDKSISDWDILFQPAQSLTQSNLFSTIKLA